MAQELFVIGTGGAWTSPLQHPPTFVSHDHPDREPELCAHLQRSGWFPEGILHSFQNFSTFPPRPKLQPKLFGIQCVLWLECQVHGGLGLSPSPDISCGYSGSPALPVATRAGPLAEVACVMNAGTEAAVC